MDAGKIYNSWPLMGFSYFPDDNSIINLFKLELDSFMRLIENKKTQDRIKHTLATGKPLVN